MSDVPDEFFLEILSRLPVAPLLRFRCVSKSWGDLIDSQQFIQHHLNLSRKSDSNINIVLESHQLYYAHFDLLNDTNMPTFKQLAHPLMTPSPFTKILGSCDGLLVLRNHQDNLTILWNPSVKRFHVMPCTSNEIPGYHKFTFYGFGYDVVSDDYKFIRIAQFYGLDDKFHSEVKVYSLKSVSWRRIPDFPYLIYKAKTKGVLANGALHWIVTRKVKLGYLVAAFDLGTEEYRLVPLPKFTDDDDNPSFDVVVLGGCLSLMCYVNEDRVNLWVMKEYGVQESWSVLFSFDDCDCGITLWPLAYSKCGRKVLLLLLDEAVLRWYDLDKKSPDVPMIEMPSKNVYAMFTCLESLVLLNNGTCDYDIVTKKERTKKRKM